MDFENFFNKENRKVIHQNHADREADRNNLEDS
jgi:hypothetical protein